MSGRFYWLVRLNDARADNPYPNLMKILFYMMLAVRLDASRRVREKLVPSPLHSSFGNQPKELMVQGLKVLLLLVMG